MIDPSFCGYFVNESGIPLSMLELRELFAQNRFVTFLTVKDTITDLEQKRSKYISIIAYFCKNSFYFAYDLYSKFGESHKKIFFIPKNFSAVKNMKAKLQYINNNYDEEKIQYEISRIFNISEDETVIPCNVDVLLDSPF